MLQPRIRIHDDERSLDLLRPGAREPDHEVRWGQIASRMNRSTCPICDASDLTDEHVPPEKMGGKVVTCTCKPCNNRFGGWVEKDLQDFAYDVYESTRFRGAGVRGQRSARVVHRVTTTGEFVLLLDAPHQDVATMLNADELEMELRVHHDGRVRVALLKQTFLAAWLCCDSDELNLEVMNEVRAELIAARDAPTKSHVVPGPWARRLDVRRLSAPSDVPTLVAVVKTDADDPWSGVVFSGAVGVTWPAEWFTKLPDPDDEA